MVRVNDRGEVIVSVAVPVQRFRAVRGALMLSTQGADIDDMVEAEAPRHRQGLLRRGGRHGRAVDARSPARSPGRCGVRPTAPNACAGIRNRIENPVYAAARRDRGPVRCDPRYDERAYTRIEAIESFAADVAHELRNPHTSLRSAVETLPLAKTEQSRRRLLEVIEHDVRFDRLITDISDASGSMPNCSGRRPSPVELARLLVALVRPR